MSDTTAALAFAEVFKALAEPEMLMSAPVQAKKAARRVWARIGDFNFSPHQMYCDEELLKLGLAYRVVDSYNPDGYLIKYIK